MYESFRRRVWNCIYPLILMMAVYLFVYLFAIVLYSAFFSSSGTGLEDFMSSNGNFISIAALALGGLCMFFIYKRDIVIHSNFILKNPVWFIPVIAVGIFAAHGLSILVSFMNIDNIIGSYSDSVQSVFAYDAAVAFLKSAVLVPLCEEVLFRGVIYNRLKKYWGLWPAALISSALFGIYHLNLAQGLYAFIYAILLCLVYDCFRNLWVPVSMHAAANTVSLLLTYLNVSYPAIWIYVVAMTTTLAAAAVIYIFLIRKKKSDVEEDIAAARAAAGF